MPDIEKKEPVLTEAPSDVQAPSDAPALPDARETGENESTLHILLNKLPFRIYVMIIFAGAFMVVAGISIVREPQKSTADMVIAVICFVIGAISAIFGGRGAVLSPNKTLKE